MQAGASLDALQLNVLRAMKVSRGKANTKSHETTVLHTSSLLREQRHPFPEICGRPLSGSSLAGLAFFGRAQSQWPVASQR